MLAMRLERLSQCFMGSMKTNDVHSCVCSRPDVTRPLITAKLASLSLSRPDDRRLDIYLSEDLSRQHWMGRVRKVCKLGSRTVTRTLPGAKETVIERTIIYRMF